jgi:hypothetical protein
MRSLPCVLAAVFVTFSGSAVAATPTRLVEGVLHFEDFIPENTSVYPTMPAHFVERPIRGVTVALKVAGATVATATTDSSGKFLVAVPVGDLPVGQALEARWLARDHASDVYLDLDWANDRLEWTHATIIDADTGKLTFPARLVTEGELSAHFNIQYAIQAGRTYADLRRDDSDDISRVNVQYPDADWNNYSFQWTEITISGLPSHGYGGTENGDYGFVDQMILHEYGHSLTNDIGDFDADGHDHGACDDFGYEFAWQEGFPTFLARAVHTGGTGHSVLGDPTLESACGSPSTESTTWAILGDILDSDNADPIGYPDDSYDRINGFESAGGLPLRDYPFRIFDNELDDVSFSWPYTDPPTNILSFHDAFVARGLYPGSHAELDRIYWRHGVHPHAVANYSVPYVQPISATVAPGASVAVTFIVQSTGYTYADEGVTYRISTIDGTNIDTFSIPSFTGQKTLTRVVTVPWLPEGFNWIWVTPDPDDRMLEQTDGDANFLFFRVAHCGNGVCSHGETCSDCSADCGGCCGDGACGSGESCSSCPWDCGGCDICGDGYCTSDEVGSCPDDCGYEPPEPPTCFVAGTAITMADGSTKPIEQVAVGDLVLSWDEQGARLVAGHVSETFVHPDSDRLVVVNGELRTTTMHRFFVDGQWVRADALEPGAALLTVAPGPSGVTSGAGATMVIGRGEVQTLASLPGRATTYNFEVDVHHDYFAGGVLVHNLKPKDDP